MDYRYMHCPDLANGRICAYGCTWKYPICHMYMQNRCWCKKGGWCEKGWHPGEQKAWRQRQHPAGAKNDMNAQHSKDDEWSRSYSGKRTRTPESKEPESSGHEERNKKTRRARSTSEEADFQIAVSILKLQTDVLDEATLHAAYRKQMADVDNSNKAEVPGKCDKLTWAMHLISEQIGL